jgi:hypothetical protein
MVSVGDGQTVQVTMPTAATITVPGGPDFTATKKRIYRTVSGTSDAVYLFVAEVAVATVNYVDSSGVEDLGEVLPTEEYDLPPQNLRHLALMPGGFMLGADSNKLRASEPYLPYAWPAMYERVRDNKILGIVVYGGTAVLATEANPELCWGTDPASLAFRKIDQVYPCVSGRTLVSTGFAAVYVSPVGLVMVTDAGARVVTERYFGRVEWQALIGDGTGGYRAMTAAWRNGAYWLVFDGVDGIIFKQDGDDFRIGQVTMIFPTALHIERGTEDIYQAQGWADPSGRVLWRWDDPAALPMMATWRSKLCHMAREVNFAALQVHARAYHSPPTQSLTVRVYADGALKLTATVANQDPIRMPGGFLARDWQVEITGNVEVQSVQLAETIDELRQVGL